MDTIKEFDLSAAGGPKYRALADEIERAIRSHELSEGSKMPPVRDLAWDLKVTPAPLRGPISG